MNADTKAQRGLFGRLLDLLTNAFERDTGGRFSGVTSDPQEAKEEEEDRLSELLDPKGHKAKKQAANANFGYPARKAKAEELSAQAEESGQAEHHTAAAEAHRAAAKEAAEPAATGGEKDYEAAGNHANRAAAHENTAKICAGNIGRGSAPRAGGGVATGSVSIPGGGGDTSAGDGDSGGDNGGAGYTAAPGGGGSLAATDTSGDAMGSGSVSPHVGVGLNAASGADIAALKPGKPPKQPKAPKKPKGTATTPAPAETPPATTTNARKCPECGGEIGKDGECEDCEYVMNALADNAQGETMELTINGVSVVVNDEWGALYQGAKAAGYSDSAAAAMASKTASGGGESQEASAASAHAEKSKTAGAHKAAAAAHRSAAEHHKEEGNDEQAREHSKAAKYHSAKAKKMTNNEAAVKAMDRATLTKTLVANCKCEAPELAAMSDQTMRRFLLNALAEGSNSDETGKGEKARANTDDDGDEDENGDFGDEPMPPKKKDIAGNRAQEQQWLGTMPPRFREMWNGVVNHDKQARQTLAGRLIQVANASPEPRKNMILNKLKTNPPLAQLQELLVLVGNSSAVADPDDLPPLYVGAAAPVDNFDASGGATEDEGLPILTMNDLQREDDARRAVRVG